MDELRRLVAQRAGISEPQAGLAVSAVLAFLAARLPSPSMGRIREALADGQPSRERRPAPEAT